MNTSKQKYEVIYRGENAPGGYLDRYSYDGISGATPEEAVTEYASVEGMSDGDANNYLYAGEIVIVDLAGNKIEGHEVYYVG